MNIGIYQSAATNIGVYQAGSASVSTIVTPDTIALLVGVQPPTIETAVIRVNTILARLILNSPSISVFLPAHIIDTIRLSSKIEKILTRPALMKKTIIKKSRIDKVIEMNSALK